VSRFIRNDRSIFKLVLGGSNMLGLAPNFVSFCLLEYSDLVFCFKILVTGESDLKAVLSV
jgi:hypothetical protein